MRCKRPARWLEEPVLPSRRDVLKTMGLAGAALAATPESGFPAPWFQEGEEVVPFTDVPADFSTRRGEFERSVTRRRVKSAIARVTRTPAGRLKIFGVAWTEGTGLASVEVRIDSGSWQTAELDDGNPHAWTFFHLETDSLPAGEHHLVSRATDAKGRSQPENLETKKTYWEDNAQFRRTIAVT